MILQKGCGVVIVKTQEMDMDLQQIETTGLRAHL
jgi:hypothetical protein